MNNDEFYVGYEKRAPRGLSRFIVWVVAIVSTLVLAYSVINHFLRLPFHSGISHGKYVTLKGVFVVNPYPMLLSKRPGKSAPDQSAISRYYVVPPGKKGLGASAKKWDGKYVSMGGKLIFREHQTMFVINQKSIKELKSKAAKKRSKKILNASKSRDLGEFHLKGEIVDSKCYLGQMKPGEGKTHRACATLCIRGGLPPLFITESPKLGLKRLYLVLISEEGHPVNQEILDLVAEPVEIKGQIIQKDNLYFFRANPRAYTRLSSF